MSKTLLDELTGCIDATQDAICDIVDVDYFCNRFFGDIGDWLEENHPDDIINRAERIENERNNEVLSAKELKADRLEYESNAKRGE